MEYNIIHTQMCSLRILLTANDGANQDSRYRSKAPKIQQSHKPNIITNLTRNLRKEIFNARETWNFLI